MLVNPLTYSTALLTALLTGASPTDRRPVSTSFAVTVAFGIVLLAASAALANRKSIYQFRMKFLRASQLY